jgi:hypothetical protein
MRTKRAVAAGIAGCVAAAAIAGAAIGQTTGGPIHVWESDNLASSGPSHIIITGAISDYGKDFHGVAGKQHQINKLVLQKGSFEVNVLKLSAKTHLNPGSCTITGTGTGTVPIVPGSGTGAYAGITGSTRATITLAFVVPKTATGTCKMNGNVVTGFAFIAGSGRVSFP